MYLPLSPCLSIHGLTLLALCCALRVARGSAPLRQFCYRRLELPCGSSTVFLVACIARCLFVLWGWFLAPTFILLR